MFAGSLIQQRHVPVGRQDRNREGMRGSVTCQENDPGEFVQLVLGTAQHDAFSEVFISSITDGQANATAQDRRVWGF